jgi:hypothetical protein
VYIWHLIGVVVVNERRIDRDEDEPEDKKNESHTWIYVQTFQHSVVYCKCTVTVLTVSK